MLNRLPSFTQKLVGEVQQTLAATSSAEFSCAPAGPFFTKRFQDSGVTGSQVDAFIKKAAGKYGVNPNVICTIIKIESNFNPEAVSKTGAVGLMQIMPSTAASECGLNREDLFNIQKNVDCGSRYYAKLLKLCKNDLVLAAAAYNAGPGKVCLVKTPSVPNIPETRNYAKNFRRELYSRLA